MLIYKGKIISNTDKNIKYYSNPNFDVYYKGIVFVSGKKEGIESIEFIYETIISKWHRNFMSIYGNYCIYLIDKKTNTQYFFTDNSGIFKCYCYNNYISTSFLELVNYLPNFTIDDLNHESLTEFFHFGFPYLNNTLIKGIERIEADSYFIFKNDELNGLKKGLPAINTLCNIDIDTFFNDFTYAIGDKKLSIDLTGGFDSRMILSFILKKIHNFELAISGLKKNSDIKIAKKIAKKIKHKFYATIHKVENNPIPQLKEIFKTTDAQIDIIEYHRNNQLNNDRKQRKIDLQISGVGGELYKDFWWLQDFPFYNKKSTSYEKLYNLRIESTSFPDYIIGEKLIEQSAQLKHTTLKKLKEYELDNNTQSYDNIYFNFKMKTNAGVYITLSNNYFESYAPLLELELVKLGFNLPRKQRFYNNFHRQTISKNSKELSKIRTTEGITCSNNLVYKLSDTVFYISDKALRLTKQILRKVLNKTFLQDTPNNNLIYSLCKQSKLLTKHITLLQHHNILNKNISAQNIPNKMIGKIITLGLLIEKLKSD